MLNPVYTYIKYIICIEFAGNIFKQAKANLFAHS